MGVHKYLGLIVLLNFISRFGQMLFGDCSMGLGSYMNIGSPRQAGVFSVSTCLLPHALLSLSSLIFDRVPKNRVVGKPMIWQEFRLHNINFALRSVIVTWLAWLSIYKNHAVKWRRFAVIGSCLVTLGASVVADETTKRYQDNKLESTTATMPYWEGCSQETQKRFKVFYAFSQFQATVSD